MVRLLTLVVFLMGSTVYPNYTTPVSKDGIMEASICCPNDCKVEVVRTPTGLQMSPVCNIKASECKTIKGGADEECWCQCVENRDTFELSPKCFCGSMVDGVEEDY